jgi:hypothetical protein
MIGIIPATSKTFEVYGMFNQSIPVENKLYVDPTDNRVYIYSLSEKRSNPNTGFFPIWDGKNKYVSKFSNEKYLDKDVIKMDMTSLVSKIDADTANKVLYLQRRAENNDILTPQIKESDNMFTQCIKGVFSVKQLTFVDLMDLSGLDEKLITSYYSALTKIAFMRLERWTIWIDIIFHLDFSITVYKEEKKLLTYTHSSDKFDTGIVNYDNIAKTKDDFLKKIVKILMIMEGISKDNLRSDQIDDYTINNMMIILNTNKVLSSQLFSRFMSMAKLSYNVTLYEEGKSIFEYSE